MNERGRVLVVERGPGARDIADAAADGSSRRGEVHVVRLEREARDRRRDRRRSEERGR